MSRRQPTESIAADNTPPPSYAEAILAPTEILPAYGADEEFLFRRYSKIKNNPHHQTELEAIRNKCVQILSENESHIPNGKHKQILYFIASKLFYKLNDKDKNRDYSKSIYYAAKAMLCRSEHDEGLIFDSRDLIEKIIGRKDCEHLKPLSCSDLSELQNNLLQLANQRSLWNCGDRSRSGRDHLVKYAIVKFIGLITKESAANLTIDNSLEIALQLIPYREHNYDLSEAATKSANIIGATCILNKILHQNIDEILSKKNMKQLDFFIISRAEDSIKFNFVSEVDISDSIENGIRNGKISSYIKNGNCYNINTSKQMLCRPSTQPSSPSISRSTDFIRISHV